MARAALMGVLSGAMAGFKGIPERFSSGLKDNKRLLYMAERVVGHGGR